MNAETGEKAGPHARIAERSPMMLRHAKLVCQSGEYLCRVREVSPLGVGLNFHHDVPPEPRILLQLANDRTYPVERVWLGKRQAGYRFGCDVSVEEFTAEHSGFEPRPLRLKVKAPARLIEGNIVSDARLLDISCAGAKFTSERKHTAHRLLSFQIAGLPLQLGTITWLGDDTFGLRFQHTLSSRELAACAWSLQPFEQPLPRGFANLLSKSRAA